MSYIYIMKKICLYAENDIRTKKDLIISTHLSDVTAERKNFV